MSPARDSIRFGEFVLDPAAYELRRQGRRVKLERRPMDLLLLLLERPGELVTRQEIADRMWGQDVFVDVDTGVHTLVWKLRTALRDSVHEPAYIETVPSRGYRFVASIERVAAPTAPGGTRTDDDGPADSPDAVAATSDATPVRRRTGVIGVSVVGVCVLVLAGWIWWRDAARGAAGDQRPITLAVLPFDGSGLPPDQAHVAMGLSEEASTWLAQIAPAQLIVKGRSRAYQSSSKSAAQIGRELSVDYLVEGSVSGSAGQLGVIATLIRTRDGQHVWSRSYEREPAHLQDVQRELSATIAGQVLQQLSPGRADGLARRRARTPEAYDAYLRARHAETRRTPDAIRAAVQHYERAIAIEPTYALAWSGLALTLASSTINSSVPPVDVWPRARQAAARAIELSADLAEAQHAAGYVSWLLDWEWRVAETRLRRAVALDGSSATAYRTLGHLLSQTGRHAEALDAVARASELEPLDPLHHSLASQVAYQARDFGRALEQARRTLLVDPELWIGYAQLGQAYGQLDDAGQALDAFAEATRRSGGNAAMVASRAFVLATSGQVEEARTVLAELVARSRHDYVPPYAVALVHAGLGDRDAVFAWLDKAVAARDVHLIFLPVDARWDGYRDDERFGQLLARCGFH